MSIQLAFLQYRWVYEYTNDFPQLSKDPLTSVSLFYDAALV